MRSPITHRVAQFSIWASGRTWRVRAEKASRLLMGMFEVITWLLGLSPDRPSRVVESCLPKL